MHGDTTGLAILDSGAGSLALDRGLMAALDFTVDPTRAIASAPAPVAGFELHGLDPSPPQQAVSLDLEPMREATGRPLAALAGAALWRQCALAFDPRRDTVLVFASPRIEAAPSERLARSRERLGAWLSAVAHGVPFELRGDDKIVVTGSVSGGPAIRWIVDTGATKLTLFPRALREARVHLPRGPEITGMIATTVDGEERVRYRRLPTVSVDALGARVDAADVDVALLDTPLSDAISQLVGAPVHGVLGQSFLRRFRHVIDYGTHVLWLDPIDVPTDQRPWEYCTVGIQLARRRGRTTIEAVAGGSPARRAGLRPGDRLIAIDEQRVDALPLVEADQRLEGEPGSRVVLRVQRGARAFDVTMVRKRLL